MSDPRVKLCPVCSARNEARAVDCGNCGTDIERVPPLDPHAAPAPGVTIAPAGAAASPPEEVAAAPTCGRPLAELCPTDGSSPRWTVRSGSIVGRGPGTLDLDPLAGGDTVSRRHATLHCAAGEWSIEPAPSTNPTLVNGQPAPIGQRTRIAHGDTLTLGEVTIFFFTSTLSRDGGQ